MKKLLVYFILVCLLASCSKEVIVPEFVDPNLDYGLIGYYPFTGNANDSSGYGNHGIVNGAVLTKDKFGNDNCAYNFNGSSDFIALQRLIPIGDSNKVTLVCWARKTNNKIRGGGVLFGNWIALSQPSTSIGLFYGLNSSGYMTTSFYGGEDIVSTKSLDSTDFWNMYTLIFDGTKLNVNDRLKMYKNNTLVELPNQNKLPTTIGNIDNSIGLIGARGYGNNPYVVNGFFNGDIDEIRIYNRILDVTDISNLYYGNQNNVR